jgi:tetratricopeptide (TPR) repeat protein
MSLLIEALKRAEEAKRQQSEQESVALDISQETISFEQTDKEILLDLSEETPLVLNDQTADETLLLEEEPLLIFNFDEQVSDANLLLDEEPAVVPIKIKEKSNDYNAVWLPLEELPSEEIKPEEKIFIKPVLESPPEKIVVEEKKEPEKIAPKPEKLFNIEETLSKPWTKEEQAAAAAELQAAHSSTSLKPLFGYLALLIVMLIVLGGGYFFVSQKVEELGKSSFATNQVTPLPSGGLAAKLAEIQKKSQQEQTVTQPQTVITQIPTVEEKAVIKTPIVPIKTENNQQVANPSQTPTQPPSPSQNPQTTQTTKRLKIEHNIATRQIDNRLQEAYQAYQQGNYAKAKKLYLAVLQEDKHSRDALLGLAGIAAQNQQVSQAKTYYQQVLQFYPKDAVAEAGLIDLQGGEMPENESALKNQLNQQPESSHLQFVLGNFYSRQNRWSEAQQAYFEAYRRNNQHPDYAYNLAVSLDQLGKSQAALPYYQRALKLSTNHKANFDSETVQQRISELEKS